MTALRSLFTSRLALRPTTAADAGRAFEIQSDWHVARMLRMASFPPDRRELGLWFSNHARERRDGEAHRFAVELEGRMIGIVDIDEIANREGSLGYWFDRAFWGHGYAFEAAECLTRFAFDDVGLANLRAGHAEDNPASGRVLIKLGFKLVDTKQMFSRSRAQNIVQHCYELARR